MKPPPGRRAGMKEADTAGAAAAPDEEGSKALSSKVQQMRVRAPPPLAAVQHRGALLLPVAADAAGLTGTRHAVHAPDGGGRNRPGAARRGEAGG